MKFTLVALAAMAGQAVSTHLPVVTIASHHQALPPFHRNLLRGLYNKYKEIGQPDGIYLGMHSYSVAYTKSYSSWDVYSCSRALQVGSDAFKLINSDVGERQTVFHEGPTAGSFIPETSRDFFNSYFEHTLTSMVLTAKQCHWTTPGPESILTIRCSPLKNNTGAALAKAILSRHYYQCKHTVSFKNTLIATFGVRA